MKRLQMIFLLMLAALSLSAQDKQKAAVGHDNERQQQDGDSLSDNSIKLRSLTVYSAYNSANKGSSYKYNPLQAASSISVIGEPDVLRHISSLPGVSQGVESSLGLFVRGGNNGSNGLYFNDVPMYVSSHLMGLVSVFPADMVNETTFSMGGLPAVKGNQSSSLLDVSANRQYGDRFNGKFTLSPYLSGLYMGIPVTKDKMSVQLCARTTLAPYVIDMCIPKDVEYLRYDIKVYDITASVDYKASDKHYFDAMIFATNDFFGLKFYKMQMDQNWRSWFGKFGWRTFVNDKLSYNVWTYYTNAYSQQRESHYRWQSEKLIMYSQLGLGSELGEWSLNGKFNYSLNKHWLINGGAELKTQLFKPGSQKTILEARTKIAGQRLSNAQLSLFGEAAYSPNNRLNMRLGLRPTLQFGSTTSVNADVHFLGHVLLTDDWGVELTLDRLNQYYHILEGLPTGWSMNLMAPATRQFPAELTHQAYSGLFWQKSLPKVALNMSVGGYYRDMRNLVMYIDTRNAFGIRSTSWSEAIDLGRGTSYGMEMSASIQGSRFGTTLAYTLSKTDRTFANINNGRTFPFKFDRRHILNLQSKYTVAKYRTRRGRDIEHTFNGVLAYSSGNRTTLSLGYYEGVAPPYWEQRFGGWHHDKEFWNNVYDRHLMSDKNAYVMKDYFRIDLAYTLKSVGRRTTNELTLSVFNVLNRHNPYTYMRDGNQWKQVSIVPIMPSIRWAISW